MSLKQLSKEKAKQLTQERNSFMESIGQKLYKHTTYEMGFKAIPYDDSYSEFSTPHKVSYALVGVDSEDELVTVAFKTQEYPNFITLMAEMNTTQLAVRHSWGLNDITMIWKVVK